MSQANFNLVLHPEARFAAEDFHDRLKIPFIELRRLYQTDKIENQYRALGQVLGVSLIRECIKKQQKRQWRDSGKSVRMRLLL
mgnify:CR=1 FL=1